MILIDDPSTSRVTITPRYSAPISADLRPVPRFGDANRGLIDGSGNAVTDARLRIDFLQG